MQRDIFVWTVELMDVDEPPADWLAVLHEEECARWSRFRLANDRVSFAAAHTLKRLAIASLLQVPPASLYFDVDRFGKPKLLDGGSWRFNLSHTNGAVALAVAPGAELGVDIEQADRAVSTEELATEICTQPELAALRAMSGADRLEAFMALWTAKEAIVKAEGLGLSLPLTRVRLLPEGDAAEVMAPLGEPVRRWALWCRRPTARHLAALAMPPDSRPIVYRHLGSEELTGWARRHLLDAT
jgi:4'-phosphopantetheinyl transferase